MGLVKLDLSFVFSVWERREFHIKYLFSVSLLKNGFRLVQLISLKIPNLMGYDAVTICEVTAVLEELPASICSA
jgi:hypothetical protein